jgi:hypothetical protein
VTPVSKVIERSIYISGNNRCEETSVLLIIRPVFKFNDIPVVQVLLLLACLLRRASVLHVHTQSWNSAAAHHEAWSH